MLRKIKVKPGKPRPDFPLTAHANGRWCKKIKGKLHYFGKWADPDGALDEYLDQKDALERGRKPRPKVEGVTLSNLLDRFLYAKKLRLDSGELTQRSFNDYEKTCDAIAAALGKELLLTELADDDFAELRAALVKGVGPTTQKGNLTRARMVFNYGNESGLAERPLRYKAALAPPAAKVFRALRNKRGPRMFQPEQINAMLGKAEPQLKAMIYLGINCAFGNNDCGQLTFDALDLKNGWHNFARPKTENPRKCALWPETVAALKEAIAVRPDCDLPFVFVTRHRQCWSKDAGDNALSSEFRKLLKELGIYKKANTFYSLRRTFETVASANGHQPAVDFCMGHIPPNSDMSAVYRQAVPDSQLKIVADFVRDWLQGRVTLSIA